MRHRIQRSMSVILGSTLLLTFVLMTAMLYRQTLNDMKEKVRQEAAYIETALNMTGQDVLQEIGAFAEPNRLTLIAKDGTVLFDSEGDVSNWQNHASRQEVIQAEQNGEGEALRRSDTLDRQTYYYARRLKDGSILRISQTTDTVLSTVVNLLPMVGLIAVIMLTFAWLLGRWQTRKLIQPINELDLEHPMEKVVYDELRPLLKSIENQNQEKEKNERMRKEFSANVSHELKTPLTSISGYAEIMMNGLVRPEDMSEFSGIIYKEASRMITLVDDIIKLSRLDEKSIELNKEEVDFMEMVLQVCDHLQLKAQKSQVHVEVTGEHVMYFGIRQVLDEMIYNVCENAIKYNHPGGTVRIWVGETMGQKKIMVEDTGIGIPEEELDRIFERFYRVDKSHSREIGGTGLGLSIVKHGALLHNAQVHVESRLGKGTRMEFIFE